MRSLWNHADADPIRDDPLALRVYTSRLLGREPALVLHGGGNTSVKTVEHDPYGEPQEICWVKGSGWDLATIERDGFAPVRLQALRRLASLPDLSDGDMVRAMRAAMTDPFAPTPSVEAILHALIPSRFVDHTHADPVVAISNTEGGEGRIREVYGDQVLVVPYVMPGFVLARTVADLIRDVEWSRLEGLVLLHHGVFTFGADARTSYERMIRLVTLAEDYLAAQGALGPAGDESADPLAGEDLPSLAELRRAVGQARGEPVIARPIRGREVVAFASLPNVESLASRGPLTPDHVVRTKPMPLVANGGWGKAVDEYVRRYADYVARNATPGITALDPAPRWVVWRERGFVALGGSVAEADAIGDIACHTARAIGWAERLGGWRPLPEPDLFAVEYWELEQAKLRRKPGRKPLAGRVALVTGAASGIGRAAAEALNREGAAVVGTDIDPEIGGRFTAPDLVGLVADATDRDAVRASVEEAIRRFGGLDIVVSNAGLFSASHRLESMPDRDWEQSLALNLSSHLHLLRAAAPFLKLGFEPAIVIIGSKNVPAPGPGAGAYSVAKAGLTQLARVAALELAPDGIRVNVLHPHAVMDTRTWTPEVLASRAAAYGLSVDEYRRNNLLRVEVTTRDVAAAVVALAGPTFSKTTGAQIAIDGGSERVV